MVGLGVGGQNGILVKGGDGVEGTHSRFGGKISAKFNRLLGIVVAGTAESASEHPLGLAVTNHAKQVTNQNSLFRSRDWLSANQGPVFTSYTPVKRNSYNILCVSGLLDVDQLGTVVNFQSVPGMGISCTVTNVNQFFTDTADLNISDTYEVLIGNRAMVSEAGVIVNEEVEMKMQEHENCGHTVVIVVIDGEIACLLTISDPIKGDAASAVELLTSWGIKVYLLTGDNIRTAEAIAKEANIPRSRIFAKVLPKQKVSKIKWLQENHKTKVAMVGDGVNDSPALVQADVGIAIGTGTDVAIEAADIVLIKVQLRTLTASSGERDSLFDVPVAIDLSRVTVRRIRFNFVWALLYNCLGIPIAAGILKPFGFTFKPYIAAAAMICSSICVVCSSLLLKLYKKPADVQSAGERLKEKLRALKRTAERSLDKIKRKKRGRRESTDGRTYMLQSLSSEDETGGLATPVWQGAIGGAIPHLILEWRQCTQIWSRRQTAQTIVPLQSLLLRRARERQGRYTGSPALRYTD
eukprot:sb/3479572/